MIPVFIHSECHSILLEQNRAHESIEPQRVYSFISCEVIMQHLVLSHRARSDPYDSTVLIIFGSRSLGLNLYAVVQVPLGPEAILQ